MGLGRSVTLNFQYRSGQLQSHSRPPAIFFGSVRAPAEVVPGKARMTLSLPDWQKGRVAPAVFEVP